MPAQPGGDLVPQSRALGGLPRFGPFEPVSRLPPGPVGLVVAVPGFPLRHALPVRFETPTACAAWVKFMPSSSGRRTYSARLASHISFLVGYSTPLNAQRCSPPRSSFSVASGHLTLLAVGQVLQRSLEPAPVVRRRWSTRGRRPLPPRCVRARMRARRRSSTPRMCRWLIIRARRVASGSRPLVTC